MSQKRKPFIIQHLDGCIWRGGFGMCNCGATTESAASGVSPDPHVFALETALGIANARVAELEAQVEALAIENGELQRATENPELYRVIHESLKEMRARKAANTKERKA